VFAAVAPGDTEKEVNAMAAKVLKMKLWDDAAGGRVCLLSFRIPCLYLAMLDVG
jgi:D-Tyr-tRNAtyr deacylase